MKELKDVIEKWKNRREEYVKSVWEYKVKEARGMTEIKTVKCPFCFADHVVDKYDWVDSCKGYMHLIQFEEIYLQGEKNK